jgi:hypothetical protein
MLRLSRVRRKAISCGIPLLLCVLPSIQSSGQSTLPSELQGAPKPMPAVTEDDRELGKLLDGMHGEKLSDSQHHLIGPIPTTQGAMPSARCMPVATRSQVYPNLNPI